MVIIGSNIKYINLFFWIKFTENHWIVFIAKIRSRVIFTCNLSQYKRRWAEKIAVQKLKMADAISKVTQIGPTTWLEDYIISVHGTLVIIEMIDNKKRKWSLFEIVYE